MIELTKTERDAAVASIQRYFDEEMEGPIGNLRAAALMDFFVREIGPFVYNRAVADVQERIAARVAEIDIECHEEELAYWKPVARKR